MSGVRFFGLSLGVRGSMSGQSSGFCVHVRVGVHRLVGLSLAFGVRGLV